MKSILLKIANYLFYLVSCGLVAGGLALEYRLPSGKESRGMELLWMSRHDWMELHFALGIGFVVLFLAHIYLNWSWIIKVANRGSRPIILLSVGLGLALVVAPFLFPLQKGATTANQSGENVNNFDSPESGHSGRQMGRMR